MCQCSTQGIEGEEVNWGNCSTRIETAEDGCDCQSQTSESEWGDEPFEELAPKVVMLCEKLWPKNVGQFEVERLSGGMNNRIVGITVGASSSTEGTQTLQETMTTDLFSFMKIPMKVLASLKRLFTRPITEPKSETPSRLQYVLRIPRDPDRHNVKDQAAIFRFAQSLSTQFEVPTEVHVDSTCDNVLGKPFLMQHRISGTCLEELYGTLNHQQKMSVALRIGKVVYELSKHYSAFTGVIDPVSISGENDEKGIRILKTEVDEDRIPSISATRQTPLQVLQSKFQEWKQLGADADFPNEKEWLPFSKLVQIAKKQQDEHYTWSPENRFYLNHGDLYPRNIIARIVNDYKVEITGIVDWDFLNFAPAIVAFEPPYWLWKSNQRAENQAGNSEFWSNERYDAITLEEKQIRAVFEARAGNEVTKFSNNPSTVVANKIWEWARYGIAGNHEVQLADEVVERWNGGEADVGG
ncbi:hypothetical protein FKW77_000529 [Venturia effusa]|uniref:Aminoglycoside phosphotransferase domain-containing protein n=1 Tax=Venturia effusa TaxID=50376 RepID=A0A517LJK0_9PEZI|nr:hypothetical protein FKW77_000529 [Venturia effusa]